ncbi:MAG: (2Fe-2S)-binding protein [Deltaproteobacteria bacterium]|nr:MAG: (2Fe-2S)-binding protein [Deltaproteobacteria bacterium]
MSTPLAKVTIDGKELEVPAGTNLIEAAKKAGSAIPHYCYHEKLSIAGNCRICLVDIEKTPKLSIACNTKVTDGMVVHTNNQKVLEARQSVLEFILVNHPIDCPVCDQAGECKLQDYYMKHDLKASRMKEEKVHKDKAIALGPNVMLDQERCILCSRCIRFCKEIAEEDQLCFSERGNHNELTVYPGKKLDNPYAMNTIDICPVGALTSKDFRFKQRVWFLKEVDSVCPGCATGCNIKISHNKGVAYRLLPRQNEAVNETWMCDGGRFTFKPTNAENRLRHPMVRSEGALKVVRQEKAIEDIAKVLAAVPVSSILGIASAQFTNESNFAFWKFLKEVGVTDFYYQALEVSNPSQDDYLIHPDKNPNRAGVEALGLKALVEDKRYQLIFILGDLPSARLQKILLDRQRTVVVFSSHEGEGVELADIVLPVPTWVEENGTFTNKQKRVQRILPAFSAPAENKSVWEWTSLLAKACKKEKPVYQQINEVMADLSETIPDFKGVNPDKVGNQGFVLMS